VLLELAEHDETLVNRVEIILASIRPTEQADDAQAAHVEVNPALVRRQVRAIFHQLERMPSSEAYWHVEEMVETVRDLLISAWDLIYEEQGRNALAMLEAITGEYVEGWYHVDDSDGWASSFFDELAQAWAEGQIHPYDLMLAKLGREEEAIAQGMRHFERPVHFLPLVLK
jgi:hypothetical protein